MKKIISLAVASAFAAPVMAADVSVSGSLKYNYISSDAATTADKISTDDNAVTIGATQELNDGLSISGKFTIVDDTTSGTEHQGTSLKLSGPFGALSVGDNSGAMDATGDWTDKSPVFGGFDGDGGDHALLLELPAFNGLSVKASMSPSGDNYVNNEAAGDLNGDEEGRSAQAASVTYTAGDFSVYYGTEEFGRNVAEDTKAKSYGVKYSAGPLYVAYEAGEAENSAGSSSYSAWGAGDDVEYKGFAVTYAMGDITVGAEQQQTKEKAETATALEKIEDETVLFVSYQLGDGVTVYAANRSSDSDYAASVAAQAEQSAVGIKFAF